MTENRRKILDMLTDGKISLDEAERLLSTLDRQSNGADSVEMLGGQPNPPKYIRILVEPAEREAGATSERVNVKVPMSLVRAGMKLPAILPSPVADHVNAALREHGLDVDIRTLNGEDMDDLVNSLSEFEVDVNDGSQKVRVFVE